MDGGSGRTAASARQDVERALRTRGSGKTLVLSTTGCAVWLDKCKGTIKRYQKYGIKEKRCISSWANQLQAKMGRRIEEPWCASYERRA